MIRIARRPADLATLQEPYAQQSVEYLILEKMMESEEIFSFPNMESLKFEVDVRHEIIMASIALFHSGLQFRVFRDAFCNPQFWQLMPDGGFSLRPEVKPSEAIDDIFRNGRLYGTECATGMMIVYYGALRRIYSEEQFNTLFSRIYLMNWHRIDRLLREVGLMHPTNTFIPGDRLYFANPDVDPETPHWQGENVIDLGRELYYGHGMGIQDAQTIIDALNRNRSENATREAYLMDSAGRPNFLKLWEAYRRTLPPPPSPAPLTPEVISDA